MKEIYEMETKTEYTALEIANMKSSERTALFKDNDTNYDNITQMVEDSLSKAKHVFVLVYLGAVLKTSCIFNFVTPKDKHTPVLAYYNLLGKYCKESNFFYTDYPSSSFQYLDIMGV